MKRIVPLWAIVFSAPLWAVDYYTVTAPAVAMRGDSRLVVDVVPMGKGGVDPTPHAVVFPDLPEGVSVVPAEESPRVSGTTRFPLRIGPAVVPGLIPLRVQHENNPDVFGGAVVRVEPVVARFALSPGTAEPPRKGVPCRFQILALDEAGAIVTSYHDPVDLSAAFGTVAPPTVAGTLFKDGVARVDITLAGADPLTGMNQLSVRAALLYEGQTEHAGGSVLISLTPGDPR